MKSMAWHQGNHQLLRSYFTVSISLCPSRGLGQFWTPAGRRVTLLQRRGTSAQTRWRSGSFGCTRARIRALFRSRLFSATQRACNESCSPASGSGARSGRSIQRDRLRWRSEGCPRSSGSFWMCSCDRFTDRLERVRSRALWRSGPAVWWSRSRIVLSKSRYTLFAVMVGRMWRIPMLYLLYTDRIRSGWFWSF